MDQEWRIPLRFRQLLAWPVNPVTVGAVILLAVNDHVLKAAYPGLVTGKLSDAAGLLVAPPLLALVLALLLPRQSSDVPAGLAVTVTGVGLCAVKLSTSGAAAASAVWSVLNGPSMILSDPSDLAVLPALGVAWWTWTRSRSRPSCRARQRSFRWRGCLRPSGPPPARIRAGRPEALRGLGTLVVLPAATVALLATSAPLYPDAVAVASWRGMIVIGDAHYGWGREPGTWRVSQDGRTWRRMTKPEQAEFEAVRATLPLRSRRACVPDQPAHCYRLVPGHLRVEETRDKGATWSTSWQVPDNRRRYLARFYDGLRDIDEYLAAQALAVHPVPGGHVVIVANGRDGYARRDASGRWKRIGFGAGESTAGYRSSGEHPPPLDGNLKVIVGELSAAFVAGLLAFGLGGWRAAFRVREAIASGATLLAGVPFALFSAAGMTYSEDAFLAVPALSGMFLIGSVTMLAGALAAVVRAATGIHEWWRWLVASLLLGAGTTAGCAVPFIGWAFGFGDYRMARLVALLAAIMGAVLSVRLANRVVLASEDEPPLPPVDQPPVTPNAS